MRIEYASTVLADDAAGDFITPAVGRAHTRQVQQEDLAGAAHPFSHPRGNARNQIAFSVEKLHASNEAAVFYVFAFPDELPGSGPLRVTGVEESYALADACLLSVELESLVGLSTRMRFTFTGGRVAETV